MTNRRRIAVLSNPILCSRTRGPRLQLFSLSILVSQCAVWHQIDCVKKMKIMKSQCFWIFMYFLWLLKFLVFFLFESLPSRAAMPNWCFFLFESLPIRTAMPNFPTCQPARPGKYYQQKPQNKKKMAACSHRCHLCKEHRHLCIGIPGYTFGSVIQAPSPSNLTTFLGLCSPDDYRQSIESPMGVPPLTRFTSLLMIIFWNYGNTAIFDEIYPFGRGVYLSSDICRMHWAD